MSEILSPNWQQQSERVEESSRASDLNARLEAARQRYRDLAEQARRARNELRMLTYQKMLEEE